MNKNQNVKQSIPGQKHNLFNNLSLANHNDAGKNNDGHVCCPLKFV